MLNRVKIAVILITAVLVLCACVEFPDSGSSGVPMTYREDNCDTETVCFITVGGGIVSLPDCRPMSDVQKKELCGGLAGW